MLGLSSLPFLLEQYILLYMVKLCTSAVFTEFVVLYDQLAKSNWNLIGLQLKYHGSEDVGQRALAD